MSAKPIIPTPITACPVTVSLFHIWPTASFCHLVTPVHAYHYILLPIISHKSNHGTSLKIKCVRLCTSTAGIQVLIPVPGTKIQHGQKQEKMWKQPQNPHSNPVTQYSPKIIISSSKVQWILFTVIIIFTYFILCSTCSLIQTFLLRSS